jgi:hypothetical protein
MMLAVLPGAAQAPGKDGAFESPFRKLNWTPLTHTFPHGCSRLCFHWDRSFDCSKSISQALIVVNVFNLHDVDFDGICQIPSGRTIPRFFFFFLFVCLSPSQVPLSSGLFTFPLSSSFSSFPADDANFSSHSFELPLTTYFESKIGGLKSITREELGLKYVLECCLSFI